MHIVILISELVQWEIQENETINILKEIYNNFVFIPRL